MRSSVLFAFFLTLFALLFGAACAAPIGSPNVSSKRSCILGRCENAGSTQPENALFKFLDVRSAVLHFKASLVPSEPPTLTTTPSPSPPSSASSSASMGAGVPRPSPTSIKWFSEIAIPASDFSSSEA
ncbi:hypothetical protein EDB83DRAFT_2522422 [Lactarius deliciosus]|nr:hypothetical protein EDB83DRAFT_2522422 [Lactarius deliciosus]